MVDKNGWNVKFPIPIDRKLVCVSEMIRVEGNIIMDHSSFQGVTLSNTEATLLRKFEKCLLNLGINKNSFSLIVHIFIELPKDREIIKIMNEIGKSVGFKKLSQILKNKVIQFIDSIDSLDKSKHFEIVLDNNKKYNISLTIPSKGRVMIKCRPNIRCWGYIQFSVYNSVFAKFLHYCLGIQNKRKSYSIKLHVLIKSSSSRILQEVIGVVVSCEGYIKFHKKKNDRSIIIKLASKKYLEDLQNILLKFGIECKIKPVPRNLFQLVISRKSNLIKFFRLFPIYHAKKSKVLRSMVNSYSKRRFAHFEADLIYLSTIKKMQPVTVKELSKRLNRNPDSVCFRLNKLLRRGLVKRNCRFFNGFGSTPYNYWITKRGEHLLNRNCNFYSNIE